MTTTTTTLLTLLLASLRIAHAFTPCVPIHQQPYRFSNTFIAASSVPFTIWDALPKIRTMSKADMKEELETYGISTEQLGNKKELTRALQKARRAQASSTVSISKEEEEKWSASGFFEDYNPVNFGREASEQHGWKVPNIWNMHTGDMRKELEQEFGISTENLLERRQLARALEDARAAMQQQQQGNTRRRRYVPQEDDSAFWSSPPDPSRPHYDDLYEARNDDPYEHSQPPPHSYSPYEQQHQAAPPKNEFVNYAYAGSNGGDFYKTSTAADFLQHGDIVDAEVESFTTPPENKTREAQEVEMHRYDPRASYMGLIIDTDLSP